jgi:hypothetical protein
MVRRQCWLTKGGHRARSKSAEGIKEAQCKMQRVSCGRTNTAGFFILPSWISVHNNAHARLGESNKLPHLAAGSCLLWVTTCLHATSRRLNANAFYLLSAFAFSLLSSTLLHIPLPSSQSALLNAAVLTNSSAQETATRHYPSEF